MFQKGGMILNGRTYVISHNDWSLHRKGYQDQARHQKKLYEAIKQNLPDLIVEENIVISNGKQVIKIPMRSLDEFHFIYDFSKRKHIGQGNRDSQIGDIVSKGDDNQVNKPQQSGDQAGVDIIETEVNIEDIEQMLFEEMTLPQLDCKNEDQVEGTTFHFNDIRKKGIMSNLDKKRTILENIRRNAQAGCPGIHHITADDFRYKTWTEMITRQSNAVIIAMMDTSGSMGTFEKYCARSFFFWMARFLRQQYEQVNIVFIAHHTEAKEVTEEAFFSRGESGGTICSSAYLKALEIMDTRYSPDKHNIYLFHFSDGDNLMSDNEYCLELIPKLLLNCNLFGYSEVNQYNRNSTLMSAYQKITAPNFLHYIIKEKCEVYTALKHFFKK